MRDPRIAVTGLSRGENPQPGIAIIRSLRKAWPEAYIIGLVYDAQESGIYSEDKPDLTHTIPYPSAGKEVLLERIITLYQKSPFEFLLATLDAEMEPLFSMQSDLSKIGIQLLLPPKDAYRRRSKRHLAKLADKCEVDVPQTVIIHDLNETTQACQKIAFPSFIKGPYYDAHQVVSHSDLNHRAHQLLQQWGGPLLLQQAISGEEYNVMGVSWKGKIHASCSVKKTVLSEKGKGYGGVTIIDSKLETISHNLIKELQWNGAFELEFIKQHSTGKFHLLEINPRFPAWADVPTQLGVNMPQILLNLTTGEHHIDPVTCPAGHFYLRHSVDLVGSIADVGQLLTQGTLS